MNIRPIQITDLRVNKIDWADTRGRQRIHVSLYGLSWVNKTIWVHPRDQERPELWKRVCRDLQGTLERRIKGLSNYLS